MDVFVLFLVAGAAAFSICWLVSYAPLKSTIFGKPYSPRLFVCKMLVPFDIIVTFVIVIGGLVGIGMAVGINLMVFNVFTAIGISGGVWILDRKLKPRWIQQYKNLK
jgi:hypothetical protein